MISNLGHRSGDEKVIKSDRFNIFATHLYLSPFCHLFDRQITPVTELSQIDAGPASASLPAMGADSAMLEIPKVRGDERDFASRHPTTAALVIGIAVTSAAEDRSLASLYAEAGVEEYWIVLPVERRVEVHRRPANGTYLDHSLVEGDSTLECGSPSTVRIYLTELFG